MLTDRQAGLFEQSHAIDEADGAHIITLIDPFSGEPMHSHETPPSIDQVPHLHDGLVYLRSRAADMHITLFASRHANDVVHDATELDPLLSAHDAYFLEGYGTMTPRREIYRRAATGKLTRADWNNYRSAPGPYTDRQLEAIKGRGTPIFMPEIPRDGTEQDTAFLEYSMIMQEFWPLAFGDDQEMTIKLLIAIAGSNVIREWYLLANMGSQMAAYETETGQRLHAPLIWMGGGHAASLSTKAESLGLTFETVESRYNQENQIADDEFMQMVSSVAINGILKLRQHNEEKLS